VVEIRSAAGVSHFLTTADWTASERDVAMAGILRLLGYRPAKSRQKLREARSGEAPRDKGQRICGEDPHRSEANRNLTQSPCIGLICLAWLLNYSPC
jgi:hypothetical protein